MSRTILINQGYSITDDKPTKKVLQNKGYNTRIDEETIKGSYSERIDRILPAELDIFSELPDYVYKNRDANLFLHALKRNIFLLRPNEIKGITLSKLRVTDSSETSLVLEWIFNYFRLFFSFDKVEGDFFGTVMSNSETGEFYNDMKPMTPDMFNDIAEAELAYAIMMAQG